MESTRKAQRGDRRRRVIRDDGSRPASERPKRDSGSRLQLYVEDAVGDAQPRITDLIPRTKYGLTVWLLCCLIPVPLVQALYVWRATRFGDFLTQQTLQLRLVGPGTVTNWLASMSLFLAAAIAILIYCVRRHKVDDYRGRYRVWLWVAAFCSLCSLDTATGLHTGFSQSMLKLTGKTLWGDGTVWWMLALGLVGGVLLLRVVLDAWRSRGTLFSLLLSTTGFLAAALFYLRVFKVGPGEVDMMAYVGCLMTAESLLVFALLVYARFIYREASGAASINAKRRKKRDKPAKSKRQKRRWFWQRAAAGKPTEADEPVGPSREDEVEYEDVPDEKPNSLAQLARQGFSKQERKQKKSKRQERRAA